jgi:hypothetical protein
MVGRLTRSRAAGAKVVLLRAQFVLLPAVQWSPARWMHDPLMRLSLPLDATKLAIGVRLHPHVGQLFGLGWVALNGLSGCIEGARGVAS